MKTFLIILALGLAVSLAIHLYKAKKRKEEIIIKSNEKVDTEPFTKDKTLYVEKVGPTAITIDNLSYGDIDGDTITHVRFYKFSKPLYKDKELTVKYLQNEVLLPNFVLYVDVEKLDEITMKYNVKANNKWSK